VRRLHEKNATTVEQYLVGLPLIGRARFEAVREVILDNLTRTTRRGSNTE